MAEVDKQVGEHINFVVVHNSLQVADILAVEPSVVDILAAESSVAVEP